MPVEESVAHPRDDDLAATTEQEVNGALERLVELRDELGDGCGLVTQALGGYFANVDRRGHLWN